MIAFRSGSTCARGVSSAVIRQFAVPPPAGQRQRRHPSSNCVAYAAAAMPQPVSEAAPAVYGAGFEVYKGKAAVQFKPIMPTVEPLEEGKMGIRKKGVMLMEFANSTGQRAYDWGNKVTFALSVSEMSELFLTNSVLRGSEVSMFHDPSMGSGAQGQVKKSLKAKLLQDQLNVGLQVTEMQSSGNRTVNVNLSAAEFLVVAEMSRFLIPRALGLDIAT